MAVNGVSRMWRAISLIRSPVVSFPLVSHSQPVREKETMQLVRRGASVGALRQTHDEHAELAWAPIPVHDHPPSGGEAAPPDVAADIPSGERRKAQRRVGRQSVLLDTRVWSAGRRVSDRLLLHVKI